MLGIPADHIFFRFIDEERSTMNMIFIIAAIIGLITTSIGALILSHKVAGPLGRMEDHLKKITSNKNIEPLKFRTGDFFIELEDAFNQFIKNLKVDKTEEADKKNRDN